METSSSALRAIPSDGGFGTTNVISYEIVGTVDSAPLVSEAHPTIIVSWDQIVDVARHRHEAARPPDVGPDDLVSGGSGVRAQVMDPNGKLADDFRFIEGPGALHVLSAPSPAATASLAIGDRLADEALQRIS